MARESSANDPPYIRAGFQTERAYYSARKKARAWSAQHSRVTESRWNDKLMRDPSTFRLYYDTYVSPVNSIEARRRRGNKNAAPKLNKLLGKMSRAGLTKYDYTKTPYPKAGSNSA